MKKFLFWMTKTLFCILLLTIACNATTPKRAVDHVDPFIGTLGDHGHFHPCADVPFGMVKLGPDTYPSSLTGDGDWAHSGYNFADEKIRGFSHLRIIGSGGTDVLDRGWILSILPIVGKAEITPEKYVTGIDKKSEKASPGLYQVYLNEHNISASMTVTEHCGFHRYSFPESADAHIILDFGSNYAITESYAKINGPDEIVGSVEARGIQYFCIKLSKPFRSFSTWADNTIHPAQYEQKAKKVGAIIDYQTRENEIVYLKTGISTVSIEQARANLEVELPGWDFDATAKRAENKWENLLGKIALEGNEEYKKIFYTAFFHACQTPVTTTDVNGLYRGTDKKIHTANGYTHYDSCAFWDTYRTKYPLLSLVEPAVMQDIVRSIIDFGEQGLTYHAVPTVRYERRLSTVLDAYEKNIRNFDIEKAYKEMQKEALVQGYYPWYRNTGLQLTPEKFEEIGFIPTRPDRTMEHAYDAWCVAQMAKNLGKEEDYQRFTKRAQCYRNVWDPNIKFFRARAADGKWLKFPEDPTKIDEEYVYEGTMWHWRWFVLHDVPGLIELFGGKEKFVSELDYFFSNNLYTQGNQPDLHAPFLFNYAGAPWLTQKWVRKILTEPMTQLYATHESFEQPITDRIYKTTPDGYLLEMDDDCGCMSGWFVLAAMGLYQVAPGLPIYQISSPIFDKITIKLDGRFYSGKEFTIAAKDLSAENIYIQSAMLNGKTYEKSNISHADIVKGGTLVFQMGPAPNKSWGLCGISPQSR